MSATDGFKGEGEVVRIFNCLSLYAWSDFLLAIQKALRA